MFIITYTLYHSVLISLICWSFCYSQYKLMQGRPLSPLTMQVALTPLGLVSAQMPLISNSTHSAKLLFFEKKKSTGARQLHLMMNQVGLGRCIHYLNIRANATCPLLQSAKREAYFREIMVTSLHTCLGCSSTQFRCTSGECIPTFARCGGVRTCSDGSDERNCRKYKCCCST